MTTQSETCEHCGSEMTQFQENGRHWFKCGSIKNIFRGTPCLDHQMKSLNERIELLQEIGSGLCELLEGQTPNANCSCHISPPCNDCVDHAGTRELIEHWKRVNP